MLFDLKYAFRQVRKSPGFTAIAILILGIGIGVTVAVFTLIDAVLLRALPVRDASQLVLALNVRTQGKNTQSSDQLSYPIYEYFRDHVQSLDGVLAASRNARSLVVNSLGQPNGLPIQSSEVSGNYFSVLGVPAMIGRTLAPSDDVKDASQPVAVLSYSIWQRIFGGDPGVLGRTVKIDNVDFSIVGVAPRGFFGIEPGQSVDLWIPLQARTLVEPGFGVELRNRNYFSFLVMGRLRQGVQRATANAELDALYKGQGASAGIKSSDRAKALGKIIVAPGGSGWMDNRADLAQLLAILMAVVGLVLLISCANVSSLLLARTAAKQREIAVRAALGAARSRIIRQLVAEGLILSIGSGVLGLLAVRWLGEIFGSIESGINLSPDGTVLLFAIGVSVATGVLVGLVPAMQFSQIDLLSALKSQGNTTAGSPRQRSNRILVVAQIALSVCLLAGAGLFVRSLQGLKNVDLGFNRENLLLVRLNFDSYDATRQANFEKEILASVGALPEVRATTIATGGLSGGATGKIGVQGYVPRPDEDMEVSFVNSGPHFFEIMGIPLLKGRSFEPADIFPAGGQSPSVSPKVIINQSMARKFFGDEDPIGRHLSIMSWPATEIIGVARDTKYNNLSDDTELLVFLPSGYYPGSSRLTIAVRTVRDPRALAASVSAVIKRIDPNVRITQEVTMDDVVSSFLAQERLVSQVAGYSGSFALCLACLGLYGLLSCDVAQRTREIGVRMALGARSGNIVALIVKQAMGLTSLGCIAGLVASIAMMHLIASKLYKVTVTDPLTFAGTIGLLAAVAFLASWLPARRATQVDPIVALRAE